jgi:RHS repeat-associated protein
MYFDTAYAPFGENYANAGTTDLDFTGQRQDITSGIYDFQYREYNPAHGRWISADPAGIAAVNPSNPQTWNRYPYVANEPLAATDPTGLVIWIGGGPPPPPPPDPGGGDPGGSLGNGGSDCGGNGCTLTARADRGQRDPDPANACTGPNPPIPCAPKDGSQQPQPPQQPTPQATQPDSNRFFSEKTCFYMDWAEGYATVVAFPNAENPVGWGLGVGAFGAWAIGKIGGC